MTSNPTQTSASPPTTTTDRLGPMLVKLAITILIGGFASLLDATITSVATESLISQYQTTLSTVQWVSAGYLLALSFVIPTTGWAAERFGAKTVWIASISVFLLGSVLSGLAWSIPSLIVFRVLQGLGGGMIMPLGQAIVNQAAGPERMGRVNSLIAVPAQLSPILGPVLGGVLIDAASWRWLFFINVPICVVALAMSWRVLPSGQRSRASRLDVRGMLMISPGLAVLVYALSQIAGHDHPFDPPGVLIPLVLGVVLIAGYGLYALRWATAPIVDLRLFANRTFTASSLVMFFFGISLFGAMFLLPLYYLQGRGMSTIATGLLLAPQGLGTLVALTVVGRLSDRIAARPLVLVGMALAAVGTLAFATVGPGTSSTLLAVSLFMRGVGLGAAIIPATTAGFRVLARDQIPKASSAINIVQRIGGSFGTAGLAVLLQSELTAHTPEIAGVTAAYGATFWWTLAFSVVALAPALFLPPGAARTKKAVTP